MFIEQATECKLHPQKFYKMSPWAFQILVREDRERVEPEPEQEQERELKLLVRHRPLKDF
jgi:hypothetical protein